MEESTVTSSSLPPTATSENSADRGCVFAGVSQGSPHLLARADAWREGDTYVIRSTQFDVIAEDEDFGRALDTFVTWLFDRATQLAELVDDGKATEDEGHTFAELSARVFPLLREIEMQERRLHIRRRRATSTWRHHGTQASSSGPL